MYGAARLILRDSELARDAVQDAVLVLAWRHVHALRDPAAWDAWLHRLCVRACYRAARKARRRTLVELHVTPDADAHGTPDATSEIAERDRLGRELDRLDIDQRAVIVLHYYLDLPLVDVAELLEILPGRRSPGSIAASRRCAHPCVDRPRSLRSRSRSVRHEPAARILERRVAAWVADEGASTPPVRVLDEILTATGRQRPLPRWLALIKEPPMRISSRVAVGSPTARLATIVVATILLAVLGAGAVVAGASYLAGSGPLIVDPSDPDAFQTISAAVDSAEDGDTILVRPGIYPESVTITEDIVLRGEEPREEVVIEIPSDGPTFPTEFGPVIFGLMSTKAMPW